MLEASHPYTLANSISTPALATFAPCQWCRGMHRWDEALGNAHIGTCTAEVQTTDTEKPKKSTVQQHYVTPTNHLKAGTDNQGRRGRSHFSRLFQSIHIWPIKKWLIHMNCYNWLHRAPLKWNEIYWRINWSVPRVKLKSHFMGLRKAEDT